MKIFVTGANGFIGSHFIKQAITNGHNVVGLRKSKRPAKIDLPIQPKWVEGDLESDISKELKGCECLVHLSAYGVNPKHDSWQEAFRWNVAASLNIWKQAHLSGIKRFIIIGSCSEYGKSAERYEYVPPDAPLEPTNAYGASKAAASIAAHAFAIENDLELVVLRPFHIYGEGENESRLWPSLKKAALSGKDFSMTNGDQIRDFTPVEHAAKIIIFYATLADINSGAPQILNLGTGKPQSLKCFSKSEWRKFGAKGDIRFGKIPYRKNEVMRYVPHVNIEL